MMIKMAVQDITILIGIGIIFLYLIVYKKNHLFGNIGFIILGIVTFTVDSGVNAYAKAIGAIILFGGIVSGLYDFKYKHGGKENK